jgi:hypothetical protein
LDEDAAAEDSTVGKVLLRERLVHKDDASRSSAIAPLERTALHDGNPHRREVPATDEGTFGRQHARRIASLCVRFLPEPGRACHASKRQELDRSNRLNARQAFDAIEDWVQDSDPCLRRPHPQEQAGRDRPRRPEPQIDVREVGERAQEQTRPHQQHER